MSEELTRNLPGDRTDQILSLLRGMDARLGRVEAQFVAMDARLSGVEAQLVALDARLTGLEERVDRRLMETRPIWEQVLVRLDGIDARLNGVDKAIDNLGLDTRAGFKRLERQMGQIAKDVIAVRTDQSDLERRMDRLEDKLEAKPLG